MLFQYKCTQTHDNVCTSHTTARQNNTNNTKMQDSTVDVDLDYARWLVELPTHNADVGSAVRVITDSVMSSGISFDVDGMEMKRDSVVWHDAYWQPWALSVLRWLICVGIVVVSRTEDENGRLVPIVVDITHPSHRLRLAVHRHPLRQDRYTLYRQSATRTGWTRIPDVRIFVHMPPGPDGTPRSQFSSFRYDLSVVATLERCLTASAVNMSSPALVAEDNYHHSADGSDDNGKGRGRRAPNVFSEISDNIERAIQESSGTLFKSRERPNNNDPRVGSKALKSLSHAMEAQTRHINQGPGLGVYTDILQTTAKSTHGSGDPGPGRGGDSGEFIYMPRQKRLVRQLAAQGPPNVVEMKRFMSERITMSMGIPPGMTGHRHGIATSGTNQNAMVLFSKTVNAWRISIVPIIQNVYDWCQSIEGGPNEIVVSMPSSTPEFVIDIYNKRGFITGQGVTEFLRTRYGISPEHLCIPENSTTSDDTRVKRGRFAHQMKQW